MTLWRSETGPSVFSSPEVETWYTVPKNCLLNHTWHPKANWDCIPEPRLVFSFPFSFFPFFVDRVSLLCHPNCPELKCVDQANLKHKDQPTSQKLRLRHKPPCPAHSGFSTYQISLCFWDRASFQSPGWPRTFYLAQSSLKNRAIPLPSVSRRLELHRPLPPQFFPGLISN